MADPALVLEEALALESDERARLAHELRNSLIPDEAGAHAAWSEEIRARIDEIDAGTADLEDWEAVRARLDAIRK